jgi:hypothetical protein
MHCTTVHRPKAFGLFTAANMLSNLVASSLVMSIVNSLGGSRRSALVMLTVLSVLSAFSIAFVHNSIRDYPSCTYLDNLHHKKLVTYAHKRLHEAHEPLTTTEDSTTAATAADITTDGASNNSISVVRVPAAGDGVSLQQLQQLEVGASHNNDDDASSVYSNSSSESSSVADSRFDVEMAQLCADPCAVNSSSTAVAVATV